MHTHAHGTYIYYINVSNHSSACTKTTQNSCETRLVDHIHIYELRRNIIILICLKDGGQEHVTRVRSGSVDPN